MARILFLILPLLAGTRLGAAPAAARQAFVGLLTAEGSRAMALGGAVAAADPEPLDENPAGFAVGAQGLGLGHLAMLQDSSLETLRWSAPHGLRWGYGAGLQYLNGGSFERRGNNGELLEGAIQPSALGLKAGIGSRAWQHAAVGLGLGYVQQSIADQSQRGFTLDAGSLFSLGTGGRIAFGLKNLGGGAGQNPLPSVGYAGAAWGYGLGAGQRLALSGQMDWDFSGVSAAGLGLEYGIQENFFLRAGYRLPFEEATLAGLQGLGAGLGAGWRQIQLDYGVAFHGELGMRQSLTLSYRPFGREGKDSEDLENIVAYLKLNQRDRAAWLEAGNLYQRLGRQAEADNCFRWAASIESDEKVQRK